jgi:hypothetical protein
MGKLCTTEQIVLKTAPTTFNQRVNPSRARRRHGDGTPTLLPRTQTMHGNRIPVHRVAAREHTAEYTEEREHHRSARVQERQRGEAHVKGAPERVDVCWRARATPTLPERQIVSSRAPGQGSLLGRGSLRAQMVAHATVVHTHDRVCARQLTSSGVKHEKSDILVGKTTIHPRKHT